MVMYPKVKIIRASKREGLIRARLMGGRHSTAPVLTYLDSHCECTEGMYTNLQSIEIMTLHVYTFLLKTWDNSVYGSLLLFARNKLTLDLTKAIVSLRGAPSRDKNTARTSENGWRVVSSLYWS